VVVADARRGDGLPHQLRHALVGEGHASSVNTAAHNASRAAGPTSSPS
jgi:hypothetical protein